MTREERINSALLPVLEKMREHGATDEMCKMYDNGFHVGAMWADEHPVSYDNNRSHENSYNEAVNKACEWLEKNVCIVYNFSGDENTSTFMEDFREAMESGSSEFPNNCEKGGEE